MHESGFMESLDNKWILSNHKDCDGKMEHFPYTLGMKNMAGVFILVFSGIVVAFGLIIIEIIYKKRKARKIRRMSIAKKMAIRWMIKVKRNRSRRIKTSPSISTVAKFNDCEKEVPELYNFHAYPIPPPPPPPVVSQRKTSYLVYNTPKQRTAQQKIYEYKHRKSFGYY